jgi:Zn-dependent protease
MNITDIAVVLGSILFSMTFHEVMHGFVARSLGDTTAEDAGRLTLNPLKHIDPITTVLMPIIFFITTGIAFGAAKPVPVDGRRLKYGDAGMALVALAGPLTNLLLAAVAGAIIKLTNVGSITTILSTFMITNLAFFVFNMVPYPPLDGSRVLYAVAPQLLQDIMRKIESLGITSIIIYFVLVFPLVSPTVSRVVESLYRFLS